MPDVNTEYTEFMSTQSTVNKGKMTAFQKKTLCTHELMNSVLNYRLA